MVLHSGNIPDQAPALVKFPLSGYLVNEASSDVSVHILQS
jgi:hypothetical protein